MWAYVSSSSLQIRSVDQVLPTASCRMVSATEASKMSHVGLGHLDVFSMVEVYRVGGGVERRGGERCRAGASDVVVVVRYTHLSRIKPVT